MERNFEAFNQVVGLIFDQLYRQFPISIQIDHDEIAEKLGVPSSPYQPSDYFLSVRTKDYGDIVPAMNMEEFVDETIQFLAAEGFLQQERNSIRLSAKALMLLNAPMPGLEKPAGARIVEISKDVGTDAGKAAISEVVSQVIAAATRGFLGP